MLSSVAERCRPGGNSARADACTQSGHSHTSRAPRRSKKLLRIAKTDPDPGVRIQAVRAVADLADPTLIKHKLNAQPGDTDVANRLAALATEQDARMQMEIIVALGRLRWENAPEWLRQNLVKPMLRRLPARGHADPSAGR